MSTVRNPRIFQLAHQPEKCANWSAARAPPESGLARAKQHLAPGGILAVWSYVESSPFVEALRATFTNVEAIPVTYENDLVDEELTDWLFIARD